MGRKFVDVAPHLNRDKPWVVKEKTGVGPNTTQIIAGPYKSRRQANDMLKELKK